MTETFTVTQEFSNPEDAAYFEEAANLVVKTVSGANLIEVIARLLSRGLDAERRDQITDTLYDGLYDIINNLEE